MLDVQIWTDYFKNKKVTSLTWISCLILGMDVSGYYKG